ncbi:MAG: NHLP bacteriocin export ABC transporter permease/ATPase subunit [Schwartzia sp.]|nr:NHLP bacteriocin export ABC transporter permease/ATPase subunit [Schwartzia sp. (in: firmicutes)]
MKLSAGERYLLTDEQSYIVVASGRAEAYAVTRREISYRQIFLMELSEGAAAFPSMDELFGEIGVQIYAVEDTEMEIRPLDGASPEALAPLMKAWFGRLVALPWLRLLADRGDDVLKAWGDGTVLDGAETDMKTLSEAFAENESIFAMLLGVRFRSQDKRLGQRMESRAKGQRLLVDKTIADLLGEEHIIADEDESGSDIEKLKRATFLVRCVAQALKMPAGNLYLVPEIAKKLAPFALLRRLFQKGGMQIRRIHLEDGWHKDDSGVMLCNLQTDADRKEMAALIPETPNRYRIVTQAHPEGALVTDEIAAQLEPEAFLCYPGLPARKLETVDLFRFLFRQSWAVDWKTIVATSFFMGLIPLITPIVTETVFKDIIPILDRKGLATVTQVLMVAGFTTATLTTVRSVTLLRLSSAGGMALRAAILGRLLSLPAKFFRQFQSGDLANRISGMETLTELVSENLIGALFNLLFSFWSLALMCYYSWKLTAAALVIWFIYLVISDLIISRLVGVQRRMTEAKNKTSGILQQIFTGLAKFRGKGAEEQAYHLWGSKFAEEWKWDYRARVLKNFNTVISAVQPTLLALVLYYLGLRELAETSATGGASGGAATQLADMLGGAAPMSTATFIAFQAAYTTFNASLNAVMPIMEQLSIVRPLLENIRPILEAEPEVVEDKQEADSLSGAFAVEHLSFSYGEGLPEVLHDVSFSVAAGEHIAIVGRSGCGKSTLVRLLLGFESPTSGAIYYDGQDLADLALPSVRTQMGVVLQNGQLMTGDIYRNIVGASDLTLDDAWAAAEAAGIADDIREMPMQMQTVISEGSTNLSGGQRQRILIAKALAMKPSIVICDEATSALDNRSQAIVTESLNRLTATRIVVAHRLSTIRHADRIIVLDSGRVAESGTYDELVEKGGIFAAFVKRQVA